MNRIKADTAELDRWLDRGVRYFVGIVGGLALAGYVAIYTRPAAPVPIRSDGFSYYIYLPSWFLHGDLTLDAPAREWFGGRYPQVTAITRWPSTGRWVDPHPIGVAIFMAPFFAFAHALTRWSNMPPDGYSPFYQHAAGLAGLTYLLFGLAVLRRMLRRNFSNGVTLAALATVTWGTNLFHYGVYDSVFSHAYSFFLVCAFVALSERWWTAPGAALAILIGLVAGGIVITRNMNVVFLAIFPLYGVTAWRDLRVRVFDLWRHRALIAIVAAMTIVVILPQLAIYKAATGHFIVSPYRPLGVGFNFRSPHFVGVLFSPEKGLFFWSPVLTLAIGGLFVAEGWTRRLIVPALVTLGAATFLIASWSDWQFGGSFGHRGFTDGLGLFAVFLASFFAWVVERRHRFVNALDVGIVTTAAVLLSVAQMIQYWAGILPIADITWEQYRALFLRFR